MDLEGEKFSLWPMRSRFAHVLGAYGLFLPFFPLAVAIADTLSLYTG